jgi:hypothetical protein
VIKICCKKQYIFCHEKMQVDLSQGMSMSYTEMMMSIDYLSPPLSQVLQHMKTRSKKSRRQESTMAS